MTHDASTDRVTRMHKANRDAISHDLESVCRLAIAELRARGHIVRSLEVAVWKDAKQELGYFHLLDLPKVVQP